LEKSDTKILVVDDDERLLNLLEDTLSTIGYSTTSVKSAEEALKFLSTGFYNLVITDVKMPEMDGFALLERIRNKYPRLPVIFITGVNKPDFIGKAHPEGFLIKPFRISNLENLIESVLHGKEESLAPSVRRILVIDDDINFREMLIEALKVCEFTVTAAASPKEALEVLGHNQVDAVISDIKMPVMDGVSLAKTIKDKYPELPIILITAYHGFERHNFDDQKKVADGILQKPFGLELILAMLNKVIKSPDTPVAPTL
jgi:CheY-like chemotaxis protein